MPNAQIQVHVVYNKAEKKWEIKIVEGYTHDKKYDTQHEATKVARVISKQLKGELFIHGMDGKIRDRDSHGNDPFPPRG